MRDQLYRQTRELLTLTTDRAWIDVDGVFGMLRAEHWGAQITRAAFERSIENSICVGV